MQPPFNNQKLLTDLNFLVPREDTREKMMKKYMSNPDFNFEKMNRASLACGPMVKWAIAQVLTSVSIRCSDY